MDGMDNAAALKIAKANAEKIQEATRAVQALAEILQTKSRRRA